MTPSRIAWLMAGTALVAAPAAAQDDTFFDLGTIVVESTSLTPLPQENVGATVEVLQGTDAGAEDTRVADRLSRLPGVNSVSNGGLGSVTFVQVRGLPARYVGVRIDGIDVSDPSGVQNQFDFGGLTAAGIDRIEVLKGPQSALYGSEAIAGVIDISTFRPVDLGFSGRAMAEAGSFGTYNAALSLGQRSEAGYVALSFGRLGSDGISAQSFNTEEDGFEQTSVNASAEYAVAPGVTVGGALLYRDGAIEIDRSFFGNDATGETFSTERGARLFTRFETGAVSHELSYGYFDIERTDPGGFTTRFEGERRTLAYLGSASVAAGTILNFGVERTEESIASGTSVGEEDNTSVTAELLVSPLETLDMSLALRHDDNSTFGGETTGRVTAVYRPQADLALRASVGTGYRAPSLYERFSDFGDPGLQPERSLGYELGVEKTFGARGIVTATLFYSRIDDLIDFDGASTVCGSGFGCYNQVVGETVAKGFELSGRYALGDRAAVFGAYTYTDATTNDVRLTRTPRHDFVLGAEAELMPRLSGYVDLRHVADVLPSAFAPAGNLVGDYTLVGAGISYDVTDDAQAYLRVENLFDEDYETAGGFNQPGRAVFVGLRADF